MDIHFSINRFAEMLAARPPENLVGQAALNAKKRSIYDIKVTTFNIVTATSVTLIALGAILGLKLFFIGIGLVLWGLRSMIQRELEPVDVINVELDPDNVNAFHDLRKIPIQLNNIQNQMKRMFGIGVPNDPTYVDTVKDDLGIRPEDEKGWAPDGLSALNVVLWKNKAPAVELLPRPEAEPVNEPVVK